MTTVQASCCSKNMISSLLRSLRLTSVFPASSTAWTWKTDFAVSRPIMAMLIAGGSFSADSHDPQSGTATPSGGRPPHLGHHPARPGPALRLVGEAGEDLLRCLGR